MTRTEGTPRGELLCILANPPIGSGERTLARLEQARFLLEFKTLCIGNLFATASTDVTAISALGDVPDGWLEAREQLAPAIASCDAVLLAYGVNEPTGPARAYRREQLRWLTDNLIENSRPVFQLGDGPRHPSRWQRWTARHHAGLPFITGLQVSFRAVDLAKSSVSG